MAKTCLEFFRFESTLGKKNGDQGQWLSWQEHLEQCQDCRVQSAAQDQVRRTVVNWTLPKLPTDFNDRLRARLELNAAPRPLGRKARRWMQVYWVTASLISLVIILRIEWSGWSSWAMYLSLFAVLAIAFLQLLPARKIKRAVALLDF